MKRSFETVLVEQCAPTLMGIKPASLFRYQPAEGESLQSCLRRCTELLESLGITVFIMKTCPKTGASMIYLYRERWLKRILERPANLAFLVRAGYGEDESCRQMLERLSDRFCLEAEYPHEIGLFLGYPLEDVEGFIRHRGRDFTCCGYWKVYGDPEAAQRRFSLYRRCTEECMRKMAQGFGLAELVAA